MHSDNQDDLTDIESRLSNWKPDAAGLNNDAVLFAAGFAAGQRRHRRLTWPMLCVSLAALAAGLAVWAFNERAERLLLVARLGEQSPQEDLPPAKSVLPESSDAPSPDGYYTLRRRAEQDPYRWLASRTPEWSASVGPEGPAPAILAAGQFEAVLNQ